MANAIETTRKEKEIIIAAVQAARHYRPDNSLSIRLLPPDDPNGYAYAPYAGAAIAVLLDFTRRYAATAALFAVCGDPWDKIMPLFDDIQTTVNLCRAIAEQFSLHHATARPIYFCTSAPTNR